MKKVLFILAIVIVIVGIFLVLRPRVSASKSATDGGKILVAYFSATGNTKAVAEKLADATGADLFEITPEQLYTDEDLNWQNDQSRSSIEMASKYSRPAIASKIENIAQYNVVFVGFPIWWGREPSIIDTFVESYDFAGKIIVPFATSGTSGIGDSGANIQSLVPNAHVRGGERFPVDVSVSELKTWADEQM